MPLPAPAPLLACVLRVYRRRVRSGPVLLGVSGGADSVALLRASVAAAERGGPRPIVAHFDHALRDGSAADAAWVERLAAELGVDCHLGRAEPGELRSEESSRHRRYAFLTQTAGACEAASIAVAHTADDQTETVLFHLLRGTGLRGLRGIPPRRRLANGITLLRPLLETSRAAVEGYLTALGQPYLTDPTNAQATYTRNRLRHRLLPQLRAEFNPQVDAALRRLAQQAAETSRLLSRQAGRLLPDCLIEATPTHLRFARDPLRGLPAVLRREVLSLAWRQADWPRQRMTARHWRRLSRLSVRGGRLTLPGGIDAQAAGESLRLVRGPARHSPGP